MIRCSVTCTSVESRQHVESGPPARPSRDFTASDRRHQTLPSRYMKSSDVTRREVCGTAPDYDEDRLPPKCLVSMNQEYRPALSQ